MKSKLHCYLTGILLLCLSCSKSSGETPATEKKSFDEGMIAYYPFNSDAKDASGNNYHLTVKGAMPTADRFGKPSKAYFLNGTDAFMEIGSFTKATTISPFTIALWVRPQLINMSNLIALNSDATNSMTHAMKLYKNGDAVESYNRIASCVTVNQATSCTGQIIRQRISDPSSKWTHIALVQDNAKRYLYVDGQQFLVGSGGTPWPPVSFANGGYIGAEVDRSGVPTELFRGDIDDIRIYTRAITPTEAQQLFTEAP